MGVELVRVTTSDGLRLDGSLRMPDDAAQESAVADVAILVHGTGSNFYSSTMMDAIEARLIARHLAVLRINTRGHDGISTAVTASGNRRQGAAYELVDECRYDLAAWVEFATERKLARVLLLGHSLGAVKSVYALALEAQPAVERLIAISPPRLSHHYFLAARGAHDFAATYQKALKKLNAAQGDELMEIRFPLPYAVTAAGYVDKYGPQERYNILTHLPGVQQRILVTFGSAEVQGNLAFQGMPDEIERLAAEHDLPCQVEVIAGADHFYSGARDQLVHRIDRWLKNGKAASP